MSVGVPLEIRKWIFWWPIIWGLTGWVVIFIKSNTLLGHSYLPGTLFLVGYVLLLETSRRWLKMVAGQAEDETSPPRILPVAIERLGFACVLVGFVWALFFLDRLGLYDVILISIATIAFGVVHYVLSYSVSRLVPDLRMQLVKSAIVFSTLAVVFNLAILYAFRGYFA